MLGGLLTVESVMFFAIGFLLAAALALAAAPAVHARAVRLTTRRLDAAIPPSVKDMQADKDHMRAKFAVATRQLETSIESLKSKTMAQMGELGRKSELVNRLQNALAEKASALVALEQHEQALQAREQELRDELRAAANDAAARTRALANADGTIAAMHSEISRLTAALAQRAHSPDSGHDDAIALTTRTGDRRHQAVTATADGEQPAPRTTGEWLEYGKAMLRRTAIAAEGPPGAQ
jgi:septal ring factor EnvC (AmiA/AmiB activator)